MTAPYEERTGEEPPTAGREAGFQLVARRAIETSLEFADMLEAGLGFRTMAPPSRTAPYTNYLDTTKKLQTRKANIEYPVCCKPH